MQDRAKEILESLHAEWEYEYPGDLQYYPGAS